MQMNKEKFKYFDWAKVFSYDAEENYILDSRGVGKTYGLRKQCIKDFIKSGEKWVEIVRYKTGVATLARAYFDKLAKDPGLRAYEYKSTLQGGFMRKRKPEGIKPDEWEQCAYFVPLTAHQQYKTFTFAGVRRVIFDEILIESWTPHNRYLKNEYTALANMLDTIARQRPDEETRVRFYGLGNAVDLLNPYFAAYDIQDIPKKGFMWKDGKKVLFYFGGDHDYSAAKEDTTMAGRMLAKTEQGRAATRSQFVSFNKEYIGKKTSAAVFTFGLSFRGEKYGVWVDREKGYYYVNRQWPKNVDENTSIFGLTTEDHRINYVIANRAKKTLAPFMKMYEYGAILFDTPATQGAWIDLLAIFGIK